MKSKHKITFEAPQDQKPILMGQFGIGNREIMRQSGLSDAQVTYRLSKAKKYLGRDHGFRTDWRNGNHPLLSRIMSDYGQILIKELERKVVPVLEHPTPKIVKAKVSP